MRTHETNSPKPENRRHLSGGYGRLKIADLERNDYISSLRNRLLAEAFYLTGDIEKYGTGFIRVREELREYPGVELIYAEDGDFFRAELRLKSAITPLITPPIRDDAQIHATGLESRILQLLGQNPRVSAGGIARILEVRSDTVKKYLVRMKSKGLIVREGAPRSGIWRVLERSIKEKQS